LLGNGEKSLIFRGGGRKVGIKKKKKDCAARSYAPKVPSKKVVEEVLYLDKDKKPFYEEAGEKKFIF